MDVKKRVGERWKSGMQMKETWKLNHTPQAIFEGTVGEIKPSRADAKVLIEALLKKGCYYLVSIQNNMITGWILVGGKGINFQTRPLD